MKGIGRMEKDMVLELKPEEGGYTEGNGPKALKEGMVWGKVCRLLPGMKEHGQMAFKMDTGQKHTLTEVWLSC